MDNAPVPHNGASPVVITIVWIGHWILWGIFADNYGIRELLIGAVAAAASTYLTVSFAARANEHFKFRARDLAQAIHIPGILLSDTWILFAAVKRQLMGQQIRGEIVAVPFDYGGDNPASRGRRALAITYLTLTPNSVVLGIAQNSRLFFFHTIIPKPIPDFLKTLGARPGRSLAR